MTEVARDCSSDTPFHPAWNNGRRKTYRTMSVVRPLFSDLRERDSRRLRFSFFSKDEPAGRKSEACDSLGL
jgi:hypothetical protein